ncbi:MAG: glycosyltransferase family 1 protein [Actinomycetota bacterium]
MKVAVHADPAVHAVPGGVGVYVRRLLEQLVASDPDTYKMIVSKFAEAPPAWDPDRLIRPLMPVALLYAAWNFTGRPKLQADLDLVHATALAVPPAPQSRLVATVHDLAVETMPQLIPAPWRRVYQQGLKRVLSDAAVICTVSQSTADELAARGVDPQRMVVTQLAPNTTPQSRTNDQVFGRLALDEPYILTVGTVEPRKNQVLLAEAFASAAEALPGHRLVIAGIPGWGQEQLAAAIDRLQLGPKVILTGKVAPAELASLYAKASVFALPSVYEGFGLPLIEALSFGIPSVASTTPALKELGADAAEFVDPHDAGALAGALVRLATDRELRDRLSIAGPRRAGEFSWERTAERTRAAYEAAVSL